MHQSRYNYTVYATGCVWFRDDLPEEEQKSLAEKIFAANDKMLKYSMRMMPDAK